ncbi:Lipopolysaccharide-induced tumor necrosis factor-alpha factor [Brachionus plicatilis]|uniref:Lipopolysaccharide-induced tumor necrosis factor-alpha factor n=1 Tax=Brachionus plicatilis TaxID=10195 RepID=A0A3M7QVR7_BRAPC|nr:Lipopolysaccharide-induced tumor necrosis factor-alpha factor [Brachionus plicatilis]
MQPANIQAIMQRVFLGKTPSNVTWYSFFLLKFVIFCLHPSCGANVVSRISHESGLTTWLIASAICFVGCVLGCCLIPFFVNDCKDVKHYCPNLKYLKAITTAGKTFSARARRGFA